MIRLPAIAGPGVQWVWRHCQEAMRRGKKYMRHQLFVRIAGSLVLLPFSLLGCSGGGAAGGGGGTSPQATSTVLVVSGTSASAGTSVTLAATVTSAGLAVTGGTVTFLDGSTQLGTASLDASGTAVYSSSSFAVGSHSLSADYGGGTTYLASASGAKALMVTTPLTASSVALTVSSASATQGLPVELIATVTGSSGTAIPTGSVNFMNGATSLGSASVNPSGIAQFTSTLLSVGADTITADYSGDATYAASNSNSSAVTVAKSGSSTYTNPLTLNATSTAKASSCADPAIYKAQAANVDTWYLYCTSDALYPGDPNVHYMNIFQSSDLVNWTYDGNAFAGLPSWANVSGAAFWAPAIKYFNGQYYLYYATPATSLAGGGAAIGVGTSSSPAGPFVDSGTPVVAPSVATNCCSGAYRSTIDPDVIQDSSGQRYILFGSFTGGIFVRKLSADGLTSNPTSEQLIAMDNRYEGGNWWFHGGYYYLFASSTNCCNGPLSGYGVFVGRSTTPMGPYLDAQGVSMAATNVGGTPALEMNGNTVIGPGGNVVFADESGQDYILYHGILSASPYYAGDVGYTARPAFVDALDWVNGWPVTRGGFGPSDVSAPQPVPVAQPGRTSGYTSVAAGQNTPATEITALSDEFNSTTLSSQWSYVHGQPPYTLTGSDYQVQTVGFDTTNAMASVPLLAEASPAGDYVVETHLTMNLPATGSSFNYAQAGLLIYGDDNDYIRLDMYSNSDTRQIEFIKAQAAQASGYPTWGATALGPPAITTTVSAWVRIVKRDVNGQENYAAYSSADDVNWTQSGTWVHTLGSGAKICLFAGNLAGYTATFDYVHVSTLE
jgi:arabinan endo-1,5-alpha-L-arabinosidase